MKAKQGFPFLIFSVTVGIFVFLSAVYRAATTGITVDEAYTYIWYVHPLSWQTLPGMYVDSFANNHWLNTALIWLVERVTQKEFDELTIRLPNLIFYIAFLFTAYLLSKAKRERFFIFSALALNYYLHEFFGLGRGYGMAAALTLLALYLLDWWRRDDEHPNEWAALAALACLTLAVYANTIVLLILGSFGIFIFLSLLRSKDLQTYLTPKILLPLMFLAAANLLMIFYHFNVTVEDKPLFKVETGFYQSVVVGCVNMFISSNSLAANLIAALLSAFFVLTLVVWRKKIVEQRFILVFIFHLILIVVAAQLSSKGYISERVLIPSFPLFVMALAECAALWQQAVDELFPRAYQRPYYALANVVLVIAFLFLFARKYDLTVTQEWRDNYRVRDAAYKTLALHQRSDLDAFEPWTAQLYFYTLKIKQQYRVDIRDYP